MTLLARRKNFLEFSWEGTVLTQYRNLRNSFEHQLKKYRQIENDSGSKSLFIRLKWDLTAKKFDSMALRS
jgi:hypothetical protein